MGWLVGGKCEGVVGMDVYEHTLLFGQWFDCLSFISAYNSHG